MGQYRHIDLKLIQGDILQFARNFCEAGAYKASIEIEQFAIKSLYESYYQAYTPSYYERTEQLLSNSYKRFTLKQEIGSSGVHYLGGIDIGNFGIYYPDKGISNEEIIYGAWNQGLHGREVMYGKTPEKRYNRVIQTSPPPKEVLEKIIYKKDFKKNIINFAMGVAKARKYKFLHFN